MDKIDEYNIGQIRLAYPEHKAILSLIRIIKEAKVEHSKNKSYIEELQHIIKELEFKVKCLEQSNLNPDIINKEARLEVRKEALYIEIKRNLQSLESVNKTLKQNNSTLIGENYQLKKQLENDN